MPVIATTLVLSDGNGRVRAMTDARRRRKAKQARRYARRTKAHPSQTPAEGAPLVDEIRQALASGHPMDLLGLVSMLVLATSPAPMAGFTSEPREPLSLDELVTAFIGVEIPETTALLAALGELSVDDDVLRARCRDEVDTRSDVLPEWLAGLAQARARRAVRMTHVLGDGDDVF